MSGVGRRGIGLAVVCAAVIALAGCGDDPPPSPDPGTFSTTSRSTSSPVSDGSDRAVILGGQPMSADSWKVATCDPDVTTARVPVSGDEPGIEVSMQWSGDVGAIPSLVLVMPKGERVRHIGPGKSSATRAGEYVTIRSEVATSVTRSDPLIYRFACTEN